MDGGVVDRRRRAVREQRFHQRAIRLAGEGEIGITRLEGKRVLLQPFVQRQVQRLSHLGPLRGMDVEVDEPGQEELPSRQGQRLWILSVVRGGKGMPRLPRQGDRADRPAAVHADDRILQYLDLAPARSVDRGTAKAETG